MNFLDVESEVPNPQLQVVVVLVMFTWEQGHGGHLDTSSVITAATLSGSGLHQWLFPTITQTTVLTIMGNLIKPAKNNVSSLVWCQMYATLKTHDHDEI